jgi:hypothetical protein
MVLPFVLTYIAFSHKITNVLFHTIPEKIMFDPIIGFGKPRVPSCGCSMKLIKYHGFKF